jgi:predicted XRE-type DNA-binding protein
MKIKKVAHNNRKKAFELVTGKDTLRFPYSRLRLKPSIDDPIEEVFVDRELGGEAFTYRLASGKEESVPIDQVLEYNRDPEYLRQMLLYKLTLKAQKLMERRGVSKREIMRRLGTSPTQFYRLIDQTFYRKTIDQMVRLLAALDCPVDLVFQEAA